ncbi:MAG: carbohydrate ABC transporter permease [Pseudothermotoga sp.]|uniref:carbohydrate ABC transporter permease n=1 Tax=Pseudothermotoga sp. TaxID=2033661 RepID=UPI002584CA8D|nr:carbohydrate ABC transporter permease [Pseudothermotoga sp.]MDI6862725.1 carbohydrate ABC transporter permease [Pseudothermotoga sp.]
MRIKEKVLNWSLFCLMVIVAFIMLVPFFWMFSTSLKSLGEVFEYPPKWIPRQPHWENYARIWSVVPFGRYLLNSVIVSGSITLLHLLVASLSAFAFARLNFPGRDKLFLLYLATLMVPGQVTMIPNFILIKLLRLTDTYTGLILPNVFTAFGVFLLRQFFMTIPKDYEDAARIDGASRFYIYSRIILPLSVPALSTLAVFTFVFQWNNLLWPLVVVSKDSMKTVTIGLASFQGMYGTTWNLLMAAAVIGVLPSIVAFLIGQRFLIKGITLTGLKA